MSRRIFGALLVACALVAPLVTPLVTGAAPNGPAEMTIIYVDIDKVIAEVDEGKVAQAALSKEQAARQTKISGLEGRLKKLQDKVQALSSKGNTPALQAAAGEYQQLGMEYQQIIQQSQKEMADKERELFDPIERRVKEVLRSIANKEGVDVVLSRRAISYARKDLDVTDRVTQEYNKLHPTASAPAAAAPAGSASAPAAAPATSGSAAKK